METLVAKMATNPSRILGIPCGIAVGMPANITVIDPNIHHTVQPDVFRSLSRNTPFAGYELKGKAAATIVNGRIVYNGG
jgi:dihydroorotase